MAYQWMEWYFSVYPRKRPSRQDLATCRLVAHRGDHTGAGILENTLAAFDAADRAGVWGIEFDIRWTADLEPVVCHDPDLNRVFGDKTTISSVNYKQLKRAYPQVPHLEDVVKRYGGQRHLMIELKQAHYPDSIYMGNRLNEILSPLISQNGCHLLSFDFKLFNSFHAFPPEIFIPIARLNASFLDQQTVINGYGGLCGHYLLVSRKFVNRQHRRGKMTGTGFINSHRCLFREVNRGVDWLFSDCAVRLQRGLNA